MLMNELRDKTAVLHRAAEEKFDLPYVSASRGNYLAMLRLMHSVYHPLERRLDRCDWSATGIKWPPRRKTQLIERDIAALGERVEPGTCSAVANIPLQSPAHAIGCLYVLEGSTLGAQFIVRQLEKTLKLTPQTGAAFFTGYGAATREMWSSFGEAADAYAGDDPLRIASAIDAACWTFSCFEVVFGQLKTHDLIAS